MTIIEPQSHSEWENYYDLRFRILRRAWAQPRGSERDDSDGDSINRMIVDEQGHACAVGRLHFNSAEEAQVRYMAVETDKQGSGIGRLMMQELEEQAKIGGAIRVLLEAREGAVEFYKRLGYTVVQPSYLLFGEIQHYTMVKELYAKL